MTVTRCLCYAGHCATVWTHFLTQPMFFCLFFLHCTCWVFHALRLLVIFA